MSGEPASRARLAVPPAGRPRRWLMLPGWGFGPGVWDPVRDALPARLATLALAPFAGEAGHALAAAHAQAGAGRDPDARVTGLVAAWLDALRTQAGGAEPVGLVGWSLGGLLAIEWARRHPDEVAALVLVATTPRFVQAPGWTCAMPPADFVAFEQIARTRMETAFARLCALCALGGPEPAALARRLRALGCRETAPGALAAGLEVLGTADLRAGAAPAQPTALLHGDLDAVVPCAAAARWADRLRVTHFARLPDAGHAVPLAHARRVSDAIIALSGD